MKIGGYELQIPFVTTASDKMNTLEELVKVAPGNNAIDLGSGDGRVVIELAKWGFKVTGYEIRDELVTKSKKRIEERGYSNQITIVHKSFWEADFAQADLIYIYGMGTIMGKLEEKFMKEARPGTVLITNIFRLPLLREKKEKNGFHIYKK